MLPITCTVLERSILGHLLFLIYVNDLCNTSQLLTFIMFEDEINIFFTQIYKNYRKHSKLRISETVNVV